MKLFRKIASTMNFQLKAVMRAHSTCEMVLFGIWHLALTVWLSMFMNCDVMHSSNWMHSFCICIILKYPLMSCWVRPLSTHTQIVIIIFPFSTFFIRFFHCYTPNHRLIFKPSRSWLQVHRLKIFRKDWLLLITSGDSTPFELIQGEYIFCRLTVKPSKWNF